MTTARRTKTRKPARRARPGWDAFGNPVPGDVMSCLEEIGMEIIRVKGEEAEARCPAHLERTGKEDRHPSFSVNLDEGVFGCFSCGFKGRFVHLVMYMLDIPEEEAIPWVRQRGGIERVRKVLERHSGLLLNHDPNDTRNNLNEASLALFTEVPEEEARKRHTTVESCNHFGILWDPENERWITPIREPGTGKLMGWQEKNARYFKNRPYGVNKGDTLFGLNEAEGNTGTLVESPLDAPRMHAIGYDGVVSSYGAGITARQMDLIIDRFDILIVALDNDRDGRKASKALKEMYSKRIIMRFFDYGDTDDKDPGEMSDAGVHYGMNNAVSSVLVKF